MKIAIIGTAYPYRGGLAAYNERLAGQLQSEGHEVTVYTFTLQYPKLLFPGKTQYSTGKAPADIKIVRCINAVNPVNWVATGKSIRKTNPDLVIVKFWLPFMGPCFGTILRTIKSGMKTKVICILDNIIPHERRIGDRQFTKYFVKPIDAFVAMSHNVMEDTAQFDKIKPRVLSPHPLFDNFGSIGSKSDARRILDIPEEGRYLLFFGLVRRYKGLDLLLEAMGLDRIKTLNLKLIIAGEFYDDQDHYNEIIERLGLEQNLIRIPTFIPNEEVGHYFNASDLIVQPYRSATQSGVTQIAYHFEKPMVVTNVGGLSEMCPHGKVGYVVDVTPEAIADAIVDFYEPGKEEMFIQGVQEEKKKYTWDVLTKNIFTLADKINI